MDHFVIISMSTPVMNCILQLFISLFVSNRTLASAFSTLLLKASNTFSILLLQFFCLSSSRTITQNTLTYRHIRSPPPLRHWHTYTSHHNGALIFCFVMLWRSLKLWHTHTYTHTYTVSCNFSLFIHFLRCAFFKREMSRVCEFVTLFHIAFVAS